MLSIRPRLREGKTCFYHRVLEEKKAGRKQGGVMVADLRSEDSRMEGSFVRGRCEEKVRSTIKEDGDQFPGLHVRC